MTKAYNSLLLKAFNAEYEFIRKQMRASTEDTAMTKLDRLVEQLEKLGETANCTISYEYVSLKNDELWIWHDELERKQDLKEEKKEQQQLIREQSKQSSADDIDDIEDELAYREEDLERARIIARERHGESKAQIEFEIQQIQAEIQKLQKKFEQAQSQAQITKAGYIYVISNIGSFGQGVVKIGMTRRLEPMDRVRELGDASVPFKFDVHTLAFVNNAPSVEKKLHRKFDEFRVNPNNTRREFFRVSPEEVKQAMEEMYVESDWYFDIEAREFRESLVIAQALMGEKEIASITSISLPESI